MRKQRNQKIRLAMLPKIRPQISNPQLPIRIGDYIGIDCCESAGAEFFVTGAAIRNEWQQPSLQAVRQMRATGRSELYELQYLRKDGSRVPVLAENGLIALVPPSQRVASFNIEGVRAEVDKAIDQSFKDRGIEK